MSSDTNILARFRALPDYAQRTIETELLASRGAAPGSALDQVAQARLLALVEREEKALAAASSGTTPEVPAGRPATLAQDARGRVGGHQGYPPAASVAQGATAAATAAVQAAVLAERAKLLRETPIGPLPANLDAALAEVDRRIIAAATAGSPERAASIFRQALADLWARPDVLSTFATRDELLAYFDLRHGAGRAEC